MSPVLPEPLISPISLDNNSERNFPQHGATYSGQIVPGMVAPTPASQENQLPISKGVTDGVMDKQLPIILCTEVSSESSPITSYKLTPPSHASTEDISPLYSWFPAQDLKDLRGASIQDLYLGPLNEEGINILVEWDGMIRTFLVHPELLSHFSPYFRKMFGKGKPKVFTAEVKAFNYTNELDFDRQEEEKAIEEGNVAVDIKVRIPLPKAPCCFRLPENLGPVTHAVFTAFISWLYLGREKFESTDESTASKTLIGLWVLAGRLGIASCQNDCITAIEEQRRRSCKVATDMLIWIYDNTRDYPKGKCGLKNLLIDHCALTLSHRWLLAGMDQPSFSEQFTVECLVDIVARMRALMQEAGLGRVLMSPTNIRYWVRDDGTRV